MTFPNSLPSVLLAAVLACGAATHASAWSYSQPQTHSQRVSVADLDLATGSGAGEVLRRIDRAAARVCVSDGGYDTIRSRADSHRACVQQATSRAVADVHSPRVTALYEGRAPLEITAQ